MGQDQHNSGEWEWENNCYDIKGRYPWKHYWAGQE